MKYLVLKRIVPSDSLKSVTFDWRTARTFHSGLSIETNRVEVSFFGFNNNFIFLCRNRDRKCDAMMCLLRANVDHLITVCMVNMVSGPNEWMIAYTYSFQWKKRDFYPFGICESISLSLLSHIVHSVQHPKHWAVNFIRENEMKANRRQYVTGCLWGNFCLSIFPRIQHL